MNVPLPLEGSTSRPDDFVVGAESNMRRPQNFLRASTSMSESLKFWVGGCISQEFARYIYLFFLLFSSSFERGARIRREKREVGRGGMQSRRSGRERLPPSYKEGRKRRFKVAKAEEG
jgi:hypothetical protein